MDGGPNPRLAAIPNLLTIGRLVLAPVVCPLIAYEMCWAAIAVFAVASISDWFDGFLARRWKVTSALGRQLDPLVDKVIVTGCFISLLAFPFERTGLRPWMVIIIVARELVVQALRSLIEGRGEAFGAKMAGKLKTTFQFLAIIAMTLGLAYPPPWPWSLGRDLLTWTAVALTVYSACGYFVLAWPFLRRELAGVRD
jgi:CDP-diacylglycerol--glycerol-3-phosphate 3-phosphatidyltransferase